MSSIRINLKQFLVNSSDGVDFFNRPQTYGNFRMAVAGASLNCYQNKTRIVYTKEKRRAKRIVAPQLTASGKPSKKPPVVQNIPGHVRWKIYAIPNVIVKMIETQGQKIVQHKNHFSIESK
jgi:hypothetical protein